MSGIGTSGTHPGHWLSFQRAPGDDAQFRERSTDDLHGSVGAFAERAVS